MATVRKSSNIRIDPNGDLKRLRHLFEQNTENRFAIGDELICLIEEKKWKQKQIAANLNRPSSEVNEAYHTAKVFGPKQRDFQVPFSWHRHARRAASKFGWDPVDALNEIKKHPGQLNQSRDAMSHFARLDMGEKNAKVAAAASSRWAEMQDIVGNCHLADCRDIIPKLSDETIKIGFLDPPYGPYKKLRDGDHGPSVARKDCDNATMGEARELLSDLLELLPSKMQKGGVALLFRPGAVLDPLHEHIINAAERFGWEIPYLLTWNKKRAKLEDGKSPYTVSTERIWVLKRNGDELWNHDGSPLSDVLEFSAVSQHADKGEESHLFIKPLDLCEFLISKHSFEGELLLDACGCSGNASIAAHRLGRRFVYCESNKANHQFGSTRVFEAMQKQMGKSG